MPAGGTSDNPLTNPDWLLFDINLAHSQGQWLYITPRQRKQLPFMDQRLLGENFKRTGTPLTAFTAPPANVPGCQWIFHAGHCGSTLLAQILGDNPHTGALREPQVLRTLADLKREAGLGWRRIDDAQWQQWFAAVITYLGRPADHGQQHVLLKATSQCNNLIGSVLSLPGRQRVVLLSVSLPVYLATMLRSARHLLDIHGFIQAHMQDLLQRLPDLPVRIPSLDTPQKVAITWLSHMLAFVDACNIWPQQTLLLDFERWLADPLTHTAAVTAHLDAPAVQQTTLSHWLGCYSKAPAQPYSPQQRQAVLKRSAHQHAPQIAAARQWLTQLLQTYPAQQAQLSGWL